MQSTFVSNGYSSTNLPVSCEGYPIHLPAMIKDERIHSTLLKDCGKKFAKYQNTKRNGSTEPLQPVANGTDTSSVQSMLPTYVSSCDSADEPRFIDEIEIGATTISTQYGNFPIKMEYSSNDEGSLEHELLTEDQNTSHHATTREADSLSLTCEYCQESFDNIRQLNNHRRNHQLETCPICTETLIARYLKEHMARSHSKSVALPQKRIYKCDQCDKLFPAKTLLIDHQRNHQTKECPFCKQMVKQRALNMHIARKHPTSVSKQETGTFMCDLCDKSFVSKPLLAEHQRDHLTKHCPECGVELLARCLKKHMARKHSPSGLSGKVSRSYQCDRCDKTFSQKRSLVCHQAKHQSAVEGNVS